MTALTKPLTRVAATALDACHGSDKGRRIVVTLLPAPNGDDMIELRPQGTRRPKRCLLIDLYSYLIRCEVNKTKMEKLRERKKLKEEAAQRRRSRRIIRGGSTP